jgi:predicted dinucleotide-utilizing enzyme
MKFGIIGAGMIGHFHAKAIQSMADGTLHSVFDLRPEAAEKIAAEYGAIAYSNFEDFLADAELEIVTIGTPSGAHRDPAIAALQAGKHVICEKPLEVTTERIDEMMATAAAAGFATINFWKASAAIAVVTKALPNESINPAIAPSIFLPKFLPAASSPVAMSAINCPMLSAVSICN